MYYYYGGEHTKGVNSSEKEKIVHIAVMNVPRLLNVLFFSLVLLLSCTSKHDPYPNKLKESSLPFDSGSAAIFLDSLALHVEKDAVYPQLRLYQLRQEFFIREGKPDSALNATLRILQLSRTVDDSLSYAKALLPLNGEVDESMYRYLKDAYPLAIGIFNRRGLRKEEAILTTRYAFLLNNLGRFDESQQVAFSASALPDIMVSDSLQSSLYLTIANNYQGTNADAKAVVYFRMAKDIAVKLKDSVLLSGILLDIGIHYYDIRNDSSDYFYQEALNVLPAKGGKLLKLKILYNISVNDYEAGRTNAALSGFRNLLQISRTDNLTMGEGVALKALGFYHEAYGSPDSAVYYLRKAIELADIIQQPFLKIQSLIELEKAYRKLGDKDRAFQQHLVSDKIRDSMFSVEKEAVIHGLEIQYDSETKTLENISLKKSLTIRQGLLWMAVFISGGVILLGILLFQRNRFLSERNHSYAVLMEQYKTERLLQLEANSPVTGATKPDGREKPLRRAIVTQPVDDKSLSHLYENIIHLFTSQQVFKNPTLRMEDVAEHLNVTARQVSSVLKQRDNLNFRQFVNHYRILEARRLMEDGKHQHLKLEAIGEMVGFNNRTHFQKIFEAITGVTPGYYRKTFQQDGDTAGIYDESNMDN